VNRRFSVPIAQVLAHTPATPNQVSVAAFAMALVVVGGLSYATVAWRLLRFRQTPAT
jgi:uncharacterized membrane protein